MEKLITEKESGKTVEEPVYEVNEVDTAPSFPGGREGMFRYFSWCEFGNGLSTRIIIRFIVEKDGTSSNFEVLKGINPYTDTLALYLVKFMPKWTPGALKGEVVRVRYTVPVRIGVL
ncbi:MAG: energy transducer TonB [Bacteroides sp.]|nr:energy transducer TonB [Bacteroides sp.]